MEYVDEHGRPAYGVVWSPGPMPGTVWVLPESGASKSCALVVKVASREQVPHAAVSRYLDRNLSDYLGRFKYAPRLPAKAWHEALGYDPREVVREDALALDVDVETASEPAAEPVSEPVPASAPTDTPVASETAVEPVAVPMVAKPSDPRNKPPHDTYKGVHTERYMGHTIRIQRGKEWGTFSPSINGHPLGNTYGTTNAVAVRELKLARGYIDDAISRPANYHNGFGEYVWAKPGQTTMPRAAQRAAEASPEAVPEALPEALPEAVPEAAPEAAEAVPEAVPEALPEAVPEAAPEAAEAVPAPYPLSIKSSDDHGQQCLSVDHVHSHTWSTIVISCGSCLGHDRQGLTRVRVPSRSWTPPRAPAPPRHPIQTPCPRPPAGHDARPYPQLQVMVRPRPRRHQARSTQVRSRVQRNRSWPGQAAQCRGPAASGPVPSRRPQSGRPGAGPNGVRDGLSLRSPTHDGWLQRAASYRKLVARTRSPDARVATGNW